MCGRYAASANPDELVEAFEVADDRLAEPVRTVLKNPQEPPPGMPDYNLAPSKLAPVVLVRASDPDARQLRLLTWGLVPSWSKTPQPGMSTINARAESLLTSRVFAKPAATRRALIPADGWYEWQQSPTATDAKGKPRKQPFFIHRTGGEQIAFAGVYEFWRDPSVADKDDPQAWLTSFAIVTQAAEPGLDRIHDRQPVVLEREDWTQWLDPEIDDAQLVLPLLAPRPPGRFEAYPVGRAVGNSRTNGPGLLDPAPVADLVGVVDPMTGEIIG